MSRIRDLEDTSPEQPGYTCDFIDPVIDQIRETVRGLKDLKDLAEQLEGLTEGGSDLEKLREMNADLRVYGDYWREKCNDVCSELEEVKAQLDALIEERTETSQLQNEEQPANPPQTNVIVDDEGMRLYPL